MNNLIVLILALMLAKTTMSAQDNHTLLAGKIWQITELAFNGEIFEDSPGTCVYETTIFFDENSTLTLNRPCISVKQQGYRIDGDLLIINEVDTLQIISIDALSLVTRTERIGTDQDGNEVTIIIETTYGKI